MKPTPAARLVGTDPGRDLEMVRELNASIEDVWASLTESDRTARWFGSWTGEGRPGSTVRLTMTQEDDLPESDLTILACEPPHRLEVETVDDYGRWHLEARLTARDDGTTLTFVHHLDPDTEVATTGPGWEYYLDVLVAVVHDGATPDFDDYYPAMRPYYEGLASG